MPSEYSMRDTEIVTCKYKNCLHDTKELCKSEAVKKGNSYYHAESLNCIGKGAMLRIYISLKINKGGESWTTNTTL